MPPVPPPPLPINLDDTVLEDDVLKSGYWGPFRIFALPADMKEGGTYGAFKAICKFHKLKKRGGCARYIMIDGGSWRHRYERSSNG
jgi:hypothetical protein